MLRPSAVLIAALALAGGCQQQEIVGGKPRPYRVESIVSLAPGVTDCIFKVGMASLIRGRTASCELSYGLRDAQVVVRGTTPDYEAIVRLKPSLVVYDATLYSQAETDKLKELGLRTLALDANTVEGLVAFLYELGKATGAESNASNLADKILAARATAQGQAVSPPPKVAVLLPGQGNYAAGTDSFIADVVRSAGGEPVGPPGKAFVPASSEQLVRAAPDVVFVPGKKGQGVLDDPQLKTLPAVRNKQVYEIDENTILRVSTRIETIIEPMSNLLRKARRG
jgi:iron complex transport system substrate-binding protein